MEASTDSFSTLPLSPSPMRTDLSGSHDIPSSTNTTESNIASEGRHSHQLLHHPNLSQEHPQYTFSRHFSFTKPQEQHRHDPQQQQQLYAFSRHSSFNFNPARGIETSTPSFSRVSSFQDPKSRRALDRIVSMDRRPAPEVFTANEDVWKGEFVVSDPSKPKNLYTDKVPELEAKPSSFWKAILRSNKRSGARKLLLLIMLNVTYSSIELLLGLISGRVGLVSDAFHLTFGCGLLSFSLIAMVHTKRTPDRTYTYGYKRLEVLAAFTNALFLLFLSFSLAVEALHAFIQDESEHKHYLIISAVANLFVNLLGVLFFRGYARIRIAYRKAEDMNCHSIFLHVLADSIRSAGLILASWLLSLGVGNAETLCLGLVSIAVFFVVMPLFKATAGVLLQMSPPSISTSVLHKCFRQVKSLESVLECEAHFWEMVPGSFVGTITIQVKPGTDEQKVLKHVHSLYNDIGIKDLTVQLDVQV